HGHGSGEGGNAGDVVFQSRAADLGLVFVRGAAQGGVDDHLDLAVDQVVDDVRVPLLHLVDGADGQALLRQVGGGAGGRHQGEADLGEAAGDGQERLLVPVVDGEEGDALERQLVPR